MHHERRVGKLGKLRRSDGEGHWWKVHALPAFTVNQKDVLGVFQKSRFIYFSFTLPFLKAVLQSSNRYTN
jgi:hypothetical protein